MNLGKYLEAIRTFDKAIVINPNDRYRHDNSGTWHRRRSWSRAYPTRLPQRTRRN